MASALKGNHDRSIQALLSKWSLPKLILSNMVPSVFTSLMPLYQAKYQADLVRQGNYLKVCFCQLHWYYFINLYTEFIQYQWWLFCFLLLLLWGIYTAKMDLLLSSQSPLVCSVFIFFFLFSVLSLKAPVASGEGVYENPLQWMFIGRLWIAPGYKHLPRFSHCLLVSSQNPNSYP